MSTTPSIAVSILLLSLLLSQAQGMHFVYAPFIYSCKH